ncbi:MAG: pyridoxal-dependent decarboxylase [Candidatus Korobacteraceae bacterium]
MNPLALSQEQYRQVYERITQVALAYLGAVNDLPSFPDVTGERVQGMFSASLPEQGMGMAVLDDLTDIIDTARPCGPRFFGYVLGSGEPVAAAADLLASVLNQNVTAWRSSPSAVTIERRVVGWLAQMIGCDGFLGSLTGGGSSANLMGLAMAREARLPANENGVTKPGAVYASTEVHMSIGKAVALLGIGRDHLRLIPCDDEFRIRHDLLQQAIESDHAAGITPIAIVGSAGTVNTGSIDYLGMLAAMAEQTGAWFHIDGAYGALAAIAEPSKFAGINQADSISLDPHKWLYQPLDCGCLLYRMQARAQRTFSHTGDYAQSYFADSLENFQFFDESVELSRRFRALKLWLSLRYHGAQNFREAIRNDLDCATYFAERVDAEPELERLAPVPLSAVCFRYVPGSQVLSGEELDSLNQKILPKVVRRGRVFLSNATINDRFALRICVVNHRATRADLDEVVNEVLTVGREVLSTC